MRALLLRAPSDDGSDGGTGSRYQDRSEMKRWLGEAVEFLAFLRERHGVEH